MATITQRAKEDIEKGEYLTPDECLEYLRNPLNFNSLSTELTRHMQSLGFGQTTGELAKALSSRIDMLSLENANEKKNMKSSAGKWLSGEKKGMERITAIRICFALELDDEQSRDFLRKGCHEPFFNFKVAEEVIYFYCLANKEPYKKALELIAHYNDADFDEEELEPFHATRTLRNTFSQTDFENEEAFMRDLCANKNSFRCYSVSIINNYRRLRSSLSRKIIIKHLEDAAPRIQTSHPTPEEYQDETNKWVKREDEIIVDCSECGKSSYIIYDPTSQWKCMYCKSVKQNSLVIEKISDVLHSLAADDPDFKKLHDDFVKEYGFAKVNVWQQTLKMIRSKELYSYELLRSIVSDYLLFREIMGGVPFVQKGKALWPEAQAYGDSFLSGDLLKEAPKRQDLSKYNFLVKSKEFTVPNQKNHKLLVLLFLVDYLFGWLDAKNPIGMGYEDFYAKLSALLESCGLAYIYPGDPFDWFVLNTVRSVDENEPDISDPIYFFNEVIRLSFD